TDADRELRPGLGRRAFAPQNKDDGAAVVREAVLSSCEALGRPLEESSKVIRYLEAEWLCDPAALAALSQDAWKEVRLPLGLKEELRRRFDSSLGGSQSSSAPTRATAARGPSQARDQRPPAPSGFHAQAFRVAPPQPQMSPQAEAVLKRVQQEFGRRGHHTLRGLARRFRVMDKDENNQVSLVEFVDSLKELGLGLTEKEMGLLWEVLDKDRNGLATFEELVAMIGGRLNDRRRRAVRVLFESLDNNGNGVIELDDLMLRYDPSVLSKGSSHLKLKGLPPEQVLKQFLESLRANVGGATSGEVQYEDFEAYYMGISANIDNDDYFEEMLRRAWSLDEHWLKGAGARAEAPFGTDGLLAAGHRREDRLSGSLQPGAYRGSAPLASGSVPGPSRGAGQTGEAMLRRLRAALAQNARGNASALYGDAVIRSHCLPTGRWKDAIRVVATAQTLARGAGVAWKETTSRPGTSFPPTGD
ncbi:unnamed protein product, partial [Polarella glacialis]